MTKIQTHSNNSGRSYLMDRRGSAAGVVGTGLTGSQCACQCILRRTNLVSWLVSSTRTRVFSHTHELYEFHSNSFYVKICQNLFVPFVLSMRVPCSQLDRHEPWSSPDFSEDREAIRPEDGERARTQDAFHEAWYFQHFSIALIRFFQTKHQELEWLQAQCDWKWDKGELCDRSPHIFAEDRAIPPLPGGAWPWHPTHLHPTCWQEGWAFWCILMP